MFVGTYGNRIKVEVKGGGNWVFYDISTVIAGTDELAAEIRLRCTVKMLLREETYKEQHNEWHEEWHTLCSTYGESTRDYIKQNKSSAWTIEAAATVINRPILSVLPSNEWVYGPCCTDL